MSRVTSQALNNSYEKKRRKRCVFRRLRKTGKDDADVTWRGRSFQVRAAATGKARSSTVNSRVRRTGSDVVSADRRRVLIPRSAGWRSSSARYVGVVPYISVRKNGILRNSKNLEAGYRTSETFGRFFIYKGLTD